MPGDHQNRLAESRVGHLLTGNQQEGGRLGRVRFFTGRRGANASRHPGKYQDCEKKRTEIGAKSCHMSWRACQNLGAVKLRIIFKSPPQGNEAMDGAFEYFTCESSSEV